MDANKILSSDLLDIIFEGKNKEYGAYELRKTYNKRISIALFFTFLIMIILIIGSAIANSFSPKNMRLIAGPGTILKSIPPVTPPPSRPVLPPTPPVKTIALPPPLIVKDNRVIKPPPDIQQIIDSKIGLKNVDGPNDIGIDMPAEEIKGSNVVAEVGKKKDEDTIFISVQIEASFPGGTGAWSKYVQRAIEKNADEFTEPDFGTCMVKFIVDKAGKVSNVEAATMKGTKLAEIATNAIRQGPDWKSAQQNGRYVSAYRLQPVTLTNPN